MTNREIAADLYHYVLSTAQPSCIDTIEKALAQCEADALERAAAACGTAATRPKGNDDDEAKAKAKAKAQTQTAQGEAADVRADDSAGRLSPGPTRPGAEAPGQVAPAAPKAPEPLPDVPMIGRPLTAEERAAVDAFARQMTMATIPAIIRQLERRQEAARRYLNDEAPPAPKPDPAGEGASDELGARLDSIYQRRWVELSDGPDQTANFGALIAVHDDGYLRGRSDEARAREAARLAYERFVGVLRAAFDAPGHVFIQARIKDLESELAKADVKGTK